MRIRWQSPANSLSVRGEDSASMNRLSITRAAAMRTHLCLAVLVAVVQGCGADPSPSKEGGGSGSGSNAAGAGSGSDTDTDAGAGGGSGSSPGGSGSADPGAGSDGESDAAAPSGGGGTCEQFSIENGLVTPDMLIVLDRSSSMQGEGVDRWSPSVRGIKAITGELDDVIRFGLMAFPGRGSAGSGGMSCAPGTLEVPIALAAAPAIATSLDGLTLIQSTPTAATLQAAHATLAASGGARYVILVTDGAPNCSNGRSGGGQDPAAVAASVAAIAAMHSAGIKTYVLGYDTQNDAELKAALDQMAQAGGTGATAHRPIEDETGLIQEFRSIIGMAAVGCTFELETPPSDPNYVRAELDGEKLELDAADGFVLSTDSTVLTVQGAACAKLQSATEQHTLSVTVACERQTPLF
jgi:hypothetical protein